MPVFLYHLTVVYSEHCQTFKTGRFVKIVNDLNPLTIFAKHSISDVSKGSEDASASGRKSRGNLLESILII